MNQELCVLMTVTSWILGFFDSIIVLVAARSLSFCSSPEIHHFFCDVAALFPLSCTDTSAFERLLFLCCVVMLILPVSVIITSYSYVLQAVLHMSSRESHLKAFTTCSSHLTAVSLFYGAAMFIYLRPRRYRAPSHDKAVSIFYTVLTPMLNPLIYSLRNQEVMGALRKGLDHCRIGSQH